MPSSSTSTIVGWTLSIILYISLLTLGVYVLQIEKSKNIKYTASKKNLLNVTLVERKKESVVKNKKEKVVKKIKTVDKEKPKEVKKTVRVEKKVIKPAKPALKNLFDKIDLSKIPKETKRREKKVRKKIVKKEVKEVLKSDKAKKITKSLEFAEQKNLIITQKDGIFDEFKGKISDTLQGRWQETIDTISGTKAIVTIFIDKLGGFSYKIETLSYNDDFNAKLRNFLEDMQDEVFPPYTGEGTFSMKTEFKDELE